MLTFTTLASGSSGNAALVSCGDTHLLLDAGISARRIVAALGTLGLTPAQLGGIFITHEHSDHIQGLAVLTKKLPLPIYATAPTCRRLWEKYPALAPLTRPQEAGTAVTLGSITVRSFPTPHDAAGSVGYVLSGEGGSLGLCTDLGRVTPEVEEAVLGCQLLLCEANHEEEWLRTGPYPPALKARILGDWGHLSNEAGAALAAKAVQAGAKTVILGHLSSENNTPARAYEVVSRRLLAMGCDLAGDVSLTVAPRGEVGQSFSVGEGGRTSW